MKDEPEAIVPLEKFYDNCPGMKFMSGKTELVPPIKDQPRVWRDDKNRGTWIDGMFHSDNEPAHAKLDVVDITSSDGESIVVFKNMTLVPFPQLGVSCKDAMEAMNRFASITEPSFFSRIMNAPKGLKDKGAIVDKLDQIKINNSRIGWFFYWGGMLCSRLLRSGVNGIR